MMARPTGGAPFAETRITAAESVVMGSLWRRAPRTADEIVKDIAGVRGWSTATVKTLINRLLKKGVIAAESVGRKYRYRAVVTREAYVTTENKALRDRLFKAPSADQSRDRNGPSATTSSDGSLA